MKNKTVVLGVTGGIAAYKSAEIVSRLRKAGIDVYVVMSRGACNFITPLTMETMSNHPVATEMFHEKTHWEVEHISLAQKADVFVVAPATAHVIAKYAHGLADDMLSTTLLATTAPVLLAPAMNENMWAHPATQANMALLRQRGVHVVGPASGLLACGVTGPGRMEEPDVIVDAILDLLETKKDYAGKRVMVTAGPTREAIDPVRYVSNRSSGKMGVSLALQARRRGAEVILVHGPMEVAPPRWVTCVPVETTEQMCQAILQRLDDCDMLIKCAAPADFKAAYPSDQKIKKAGKENLTLDMIPTPDILTAVSQAKKGQVVIGFAAETQDVSAYAKDKMQRKGLDMIVANDVTLPGAGFGVDTNIVTVHKKDGTVYQHPLASKDQIASFVLDQGITLF